MSLGSLKRVMVAAGIILLAPAVASAEAGDGLLAGNLKLSPGVTLSGVYDSNVYFLSEDESELISAPSVVVEPFFNVEPTSPGNFDFSMNASVAWQQYVSTGNDIVTGQSGLSADVGGQATMNSQGAVSFRVQERFSRTNEPPSTPTDFAFNRNLNRLGGTLGVHPGGKVFQHFLSYDWMRYWHDELVDLNRSIHDFTLNNHWRFLPKTAVLLNGDFSIIDYDAETRDREGVVTSGNLSNRDSTPLRITGGLSGLITQKLALRLLGGWGWSFHDQDASFSGVVVDAQLQYLFGLTSAKNKLFIGYERGFQDTSIANFASYHRPYAGYRQRFAERLTVNLKFDATLRDYEGVPAGSVTTVSNTLDIPDSLSDALIRGEAGVDFAVQKWWNIGARYRFETNLTEDRVDSSLPGRDVLRDYVRHVVMLNTKLFY